VLWSAPPSGTLTGRYLSFGLGGDGSVIGAADTSYTPAAVSLQRFDAASGAALGTIALAPEASGVLEMDETADTQQLTEVAFVPRQTTVQLQLRAVARADGHTLWERSDDSLNAIVPPESAALTHTADAVAVTVGNIQSASLFNSVWAGAFDAATGARRWQRYFYNDGAFTQGNTYPTHAQPPVADSAGNVFVSYGMGKDCSGYVCSHLVVAKLNASDGSIAWQRDDAAGDPSAPHRIFALGDDVLVNGPFAAPYAAANLLRLSGADGSVLWSSSDAQYDYVGTVNAAVDNTLLTRDDGGWSKLDPQSGTTVWHNAYTSTCGIGWIKVLPNGDQIGAGYVGAWNGSEQPCVSRLPSTASAVSQSWTLDAPDSAMRSFVSSAFLDDAGKYWLLVRRIRIGGHLILDSLAEFDPDSGTSLGEQSLGWSDWRDASAPLTMAYPLEAPHADRLLALTWNQAPPAAATNGAALYDTTVLAQGDIAIAAQFDRSVAAAGQLANFHVVATYQGDVAVSGVQIEIDSPWGTHAVGLACATVKATNCSYDQNDSVVHAVVDMQPGASVDISGAFPALASPTGVQLSAVVSGPIGLRETTMSNNLAHAPIASDQVFADGFE
jgi:outer membrane protein assembly factor BamB